MDLMQAIWERHSVRTYTEQKIKEEVKEELEQLIQICNEEGDLHIQACFDEPRAFQSLLAHYGNFKNVRNYIALIGKKSDDLEEKCGYYGEKIVLKAQQLGLNTCWVALTYSKGKTKCQVEQGEKLCLVIAMGYGETSGVSHKGKSLEDIVATKGTMPEWFRKGAEAALLAPTAVNQQKFLIGIKNGEPVIKIAGRGFYTKVDLGIVKCHFEIGSGRRVFQSSKE